MSIFSKKKKWETKMVTYNELGRKLNWLEENKYKVINIINMTPKSKNDILIVVNK